MPRSAARQGGNEPPAFEQWWDGFNLTADAFLFDENSERVARHAWLAAIRYAEFNIGLDKR